MVDWYIEENLCLIEIFLGQFIAYYGEYLGHSSD